MRLRVTGTGLYAPPRVETAESLSPRLRRSPEWIASHTGVVRRHWSEEPMEEMGAKAARLALRDRVPDLLINASTTPRQLIPDSSVFISRTLGFEGIPSHSIHATCLSFVVALHTAGALLACGAYKRILIVSSEIASASLDWSEPESAALLGDGAAAVLVELPSEGEESCVLAYEMHTFPSGAELAEVQGGGMRHHPNAPNTEHQHNVFRMNGARIYRHAMRRLPAIVAATLERANCTPADIDLIVPHQASGPAVKGALAAGGFSMDRSVDLLPEYGNCIAASIPMGLALANEQGRLHRGNRVLVVGTAAGLSIAAVVLRW